MYSSNKKFNIVTSRLRHVFAITSEWFYENYMVLNADKFHFLNVGFNEPFPYSFFNDTTIENVTEDKILGIVIYNKSHFNFKSHLVYMQKLEPKTQCTPKNIKINNL